MVIIPFDSSTFEPMPDPVHLQAILLQLKKISSCYHHVSMSVCHIVPSEEVTYSGEDGDGWRLSL